MTWNKVEQLPQSDIVFNKVFQHFATISILQISPSQVHYFVWLRKLNSFLFLLNHLVNALFEVINQSFTQLSLLVFCLLILHQLPFNIVLQLFPPYLRLHVLYQIKPSQQILLKVGFNLVREHLGCVLTLIKRILNKLAELLIVILWVVDRTRTLAHREAAHDLMHILWFDSSLSFCFLHVLFFKVGVRLVKLVCAVVVIAVTDLISC